MDTFFWNIEFDKDDGNNSESPDALWRVLIKVNSGVDCRTVTK